MANTLREIRSRSGWRDITEGQAVHLGLLVFLLPGAAWWLQDAPSTGGFLWIGSLGWAWISIWLAVIHQIVVAVVFRLQLHRGVLTERFGERDLRVWGMIFFPLLIARPVTVLIVAVLDSGSLDLWRPISVVLGLAFLAAAAFTMHSVATHFGFARALGGDHFRNDYHTMPMVTQGAFAWSPNAMYSFGFLGLWGIALIFGSAEALVVAAFQHAYIWVHMYTVEAPDMAQIFGRAAPDDQG